MFKEVIVYYQENISDYWAAVVTHLTISIQVVILSGIIGIIFGIICAKNKHLTKIISSSVNVLRVVPSLALMVLMIPLVGIGKVPAIIALTVIAIPPIMVNTTAGFLGLNPLIIETAKGMGMSEVQSFFQIEFPLALPLIFTGIRTAAVETVATTSIAAYIGAGGLGDMVFTGLGVNRTDILLLGGLSIAIISISTDVILGIVQKYAGPSTK
jgi:osmoprotectant transport system permease protein